MTRCDMEKKIKDSTISNAFNMPPKNDISRKAKLYSSRNIRTQLDDASFQNNEKLSVPDFLKSRTFEIKSFEMSQLNTKYASSSRVFQSLPRTLRRRAASHNVKRVPKRLRNRAIREMRANNNGATVSKKKQIRGRNLYRLKMTKKLLKLASRIKLMRNVPNDEVYSKKLDLRHRLKVINEQVKKLESVSQPVFNNVNGSNDKTGINSLAEIPRGNIKYFKRQAEFVWLTTHVWHAKRFHMIKKYGFQIPFSPTQKCFRSMNRYKKRDAILFDTSYCNILIVEAENLQNLQKYLLSLTKYKKRIPQSILNGTLSYNDWLYVENKKVGRAMIYCYQKENKFLVRVFPSLYEELFQHLKSLIKIPSENVHDCRYSLGNLEIKGPLSLNCLSRILHLPKDNVDPKTLAMWFNISKLNDTNSIPQGSTLSFLVKDPRLWKKPVEPMAPQIGESMNSMIVELTSNGQTDHQALSTLFSNEKRNATYKDQISIKAINRSFSRASPLSNSIEGITKSEGLIPVFITKLESGSWNVILPWFWLLPIWSKLTQIPRLKVGGYKQLKQFEFESGNHHFPSDYQYLRDGWLHNKLLEKISKEKYDRRPKSKQKDFGKFEGAINPFCCDWNFLHKLIMALKAFGKDLPNTRRFAEFSGTALREVRTLNDLIQEVKDSAMNNGDICIDLFDEAKSFHQAFRCGDYQVNWATQLPPLPVSHISLQIVNSGSISDNARIYEWASSDATKVAEQSSMDICSQAVTSLIGFVTSGTFNLDVGVDAGVGLVAANYTHPYVLVRNVGCSTFHVASCKYT